MSNVKKQEEMINYELFVHAYGVCEVNTITTTILTLFQILIIVLALLVTAAGIKQL